jgi:hypothetical protein
LAAADEGRSGFTVSKMADSTHTPLVRSRWRLLLAIIACCLAAHAWGAAPAHADGDPASDVLATQPLFLPQDAAIPAAQQEQLQALLQAASRAGFQVRVALIASPADLGSITELWRQPVDYAKFLGQELSLTYRGLLLVVMPNGFGLYHQGGPVGADRAAIAGIAIHPAGVGLAATSIAAIRGLAASAGHPLAVPRVGAQSSGGGADPTPWIVFGAGLVLVALSWAASLRARPLRQPRSA